MDNDSFLKIYPSKIETHHLNYEDALRMLMSATLQLMKSARDTNPKDKALERSLYDATNQAFANILEQFLPDVDVNPDFDIEEEINAENKRVEAELLELKLTNPKLYQRRLKDFRAYAANRRAHYMEMKAKEKSECQI